MVSPPADLHPEARRIVESFAMMRRPDSMPMACYRNLPDSRRLRYELLSWNNYRTLLDLFGKDSSPFVMSPLKRADRLDLYAACQLALGRYSGKRGIIDWLLRLTDGTYVGILHLYDVNFDLWKGKRSPCMCGYAIAEPYRRQGYAEEALRHLLSRLPADFKLFEAQAEPLQANQPSCALLEKAGFTFQKQFKSVWGPAALYHQQLINPIPKLSFKELDALI